MTKKYGVFEVVVNGMSGMYDHDEYVSGEYNTIEEAIKWATENVKNRHDCNHEGTWNVKMVDIDKSVFEMVFEMVAAGKEGKVKWVEED